VARLHREVVDTLLSRIVGGRYEPGALLPKEQELASEFEISRGTAREALRALEERGVVAVKHGRGARVQPAEDWNVLDPSVAHALATGPRRREFLRELEAFRSMLEAEAAALAAERASARQREALRAQAQELEGAEDVGRAGNRLRRQIAVASRNRPLATTLAALGEALEAPLKPRQAAACARLAEAVAAGDAQKAREAVGSLYAS
jgi:DNA-binding FadR family transcriptional regulator